MQACSCFPEALAGVILFELPLPTLEMQGFAKEAISLCLAWMCATQAYSLHNSEVACQFAGFACSAQAVHAQCIAQLSFGSLQSVWIQLS